ncbi:MAG TPA: deoxyribonuclease V [Anaerolineae bacterium]|nr:deoxyribonuclease V [Anaerolineae bacterium]
MLVPARRHPWDLSPREAISLQRELARLVDLTDRHGPFKTVAGIDVGIKDGVARAAAVLLTLPQLELIEQVCAERAATFPYVPGLLSFREAPATLDALATLTHIPDVLIFDGQGYAHPRRMGIATHMGIMLDHPAIGCAKSRLCGTYQEPGLDRGSYTWLRDGEEIIGAVVRTRSRVKPVFVSTGHRVSLPTAIDTVLRCGGGYRLPEPTRQAHRAASGRASIGTR